jgi:NADH-quinone oxidoreductase subunit M
MLVNLIILIPFIAAVIMLVSPSSIQRGLSLAISLLMLGLSIAAIQTYKGDASSALLVSDHSWIESLRARWHVSLDGMSLIMVLLTTIVSALIFYSIRKSQNYTSGFYAMVWAMIGAMLGVFTAVDGLLFYVFWELALIPIYFICMIWGGVNKREITFKFFLYTLVGSLFMLAGLLYVQSKAGSWDLEALYQAGSTLSTNEQNLVFWALFLGFGIKMPIFPLHTWQPDTYHTAPTQGTMLLSGIMLKMGTFGAIKWLLPMVPAAVAANTNIVVILCLIGIVYASCIAMVQTNFKRLIAWSSIAHVGLIAAGIFVYNGASLKGAFVQMLSHGINVVACFFVVDIVADRLKTHDINKMGGIRAVAPVLALLYLFVVLGSVGLPLTNGFVGEFLLLNGVFQYKAWYAAIAGLTIILGAVYMLRSYQKIMLGESNSLTAAFTDLTFEEKTLLTICAALIIVFGLFPNIVLDIINPQIDALLS